MTLQDWAWLLLGTAQGFLRAHGEQGRRNVLHTSGPGKTNTEMGLAPFPGMHACTLGAVCLLCGKSVWICISDPEGQRWGRTGQAHERERVCVCRWVR